MSYAISIHDRLMIEFQGGEKKNLEEKIHLLILDNPVLVLINLFICCSLLYSEKHIEEIIDYHCRTNDSYGLGLKNS